ncbi:MAG TPA: FAD-binding protein [Bacillota bacterium]
MGPRDDAARRVIIVGSGGAGLIAAAEAARQGASVTVVCKSPPGLASCTAYAGGGFTLGIGGEPPEKHRRLTAETGRGLNVPELLDALAYGAPEAVPALGDFGVTLRVDRGRASVSAHGHSWLLGGTGLTLPLVEHCRRAGVVFDDHFFATGLEFGGDGGRVAGLVGVDLRSGAAVTHPAEAVVLATGGAGRVYGRTDNPARTTGDGYVLAYEAGLELLDMEFVQFYPLGVAEPGAPIWMIGLEVTDQVPLTNSEGDPFLERLLPEWGLKSGAQANLFARDRAARAVASEWAAGRQVFLHLETLSREDWKDPYFAALGHLYPPGFDRASRPMRVAPVEHYFAGGVRVDARTHTAIPGLFACGEVTGGTDGASRVGGNALSQLAVFGAVAGREAAAYAAVAPQARAGQAGNAFHKLAARLDGWHRQAGRSTGEEPATLRREVNRVADEHLGPLRNGEGLRTASRALEAAAARLPGLAAGDGRGLMEALEVGNLVRGARMVAAAALVREESRGVHYRTDAPAEDPSWLRHLAVVRGPDGSPRVIPSDAGVVGLGGE